MRRRPTSSSIRAWASVPRDFMAAAIGSAAAAESSAIVNGTAPATSASRATFSAPTAG